LKLKKVIIKGSMGVVVSVFDESPSIVNGDNNIIQ